MKKYSVDDFIITMSINGWYAYQKSFNRVENWPFKVSKEVTIEHATEAEIRSKFTRGIFPYCKSEEDAKMALIKAIAHHNELEDETLT